MKQEKIKRVEAITLIALVITIIVLLILAGVTVATLTGENGLLSKAKTAREEYEKSTNDENQKLQEIYSKLLVGDTNGTSLENIDMTTLKQVILDNTYPVGSVYISTANTNPATILGGQWEAYGEGRTLVGAGTGTDANNESKTFTANATGGEYNHTLTVSEMPSHTHTASYTEPYMKENNSYGYKYGDTYAALVKNGTTETDSSGEGESHNIIQPYIVTYMWKRIS